ncbi:MAG: hypothetical protein UZ13_02088 [Chloroflexi bacterium OLB13]|nr:MAG: hypothetical protein UZ13_02088 [Chloroflexi bacterium OLB13]
MTVEEKPISPAQEQGRFNAWLLLIASLLLAFVIAYLAGFFS